MKSEFILTVTGPDHRGLLKQLSDTIVSHQGKFINSKLSHLEGQFAGLFKVEVPSENEEAAKISFLALSELNCNFAKLAEPLTATAQQIRLNIDANDRPDLLNDISHLLHDRDVAVKQVECQRYGVAELGKALFSGSFVLDLPIDISPDLLVDELSQLKGGPKVNIEEVEA